VKKIKEVKDDTREALGGLSRMEWNLRLSGSRGRRDREGRGEKESSNIQRGKVAELVGGRGSQFGL